jgi:hypothetical protein
MNHVNAMEKYSFFPTNPMQVAHDPYKQHVSVDPKFPTNPT